MWISQKCEYAVRAVFELAKRVGRGPVRIADIAEAQAIPVRFLEVILSQLKQGGFVDSQRGKHTTIQEVLHMLVLPFEEYHSIESARLDICPSGFAYEDPETGEIKTIPVCIWSLYRTEIQRQIAEKYAPQTAPA
jgi:hypothetical protein